MLLRNLTQVGSGTYGSVHLVEDTVTLKRYAVKINSVEPSTSFVGGIKEADLLCRLKGHPSIVSLESVELKSPFIVHPSATLEEGTREDKLYLIFEYMSNSLERLLKKRTKIDIRSFLRQMLLGIEFMHSKKIYHRDLKPANILSEGDRYAICDFGMSREVRDPELSPRITTCWYRAPEVCSSHSYDSKVDIWALGLILAEIINGRAVLSGYADDDKRILNKILSLFSYQDKGLYNRTATTIGNIGSIVPSCRDQQLLDLLDGLLQINPNSRLSATEALEHPYFDSDRDIIEASRATHPPIDDSPDTIIIPVSSRRDMGILIAYEIYNDRSMKSVSHTYKDRWWYSHRILFMSISIFDRYLLWIEENQEDIELSQEDIELRFVVCLYISIKYNMNMMVPPSFSDILPPSTDNSSIMIRAEEIEEEILVKVSKFKVTSPNPYSLFSDRVLTPHNIKALLKSYGSVNSRINRVQDIVNEWL